jgi:hypothetical protein
MRTQLGLADDPSVRVNNFPFLVQAISGRYRSVDVTADHIAVGPLRDVQVRSQLRDVRRRCRDARRRATHRDGPRGRRHRADRAPDVERLIARRHVPSTSSTSTGSTRTACSARSTTARTGAADARPRHGVRFSGTVDILGQEQQVSIISEMQLADGRAQITPRDVRSATPTPTRCRCRAADLSRSSR